MSQLHTPSPFVGSYPFQDAGKDLFGPVCLRTHWDPSQIIRRTLPQQYVALPQDPRPYVRVCKQYVTSGPEQPAPMPPSSMVFPMGGQFYPPGRYSDSVDAESELRTLHHPLDRWCPTTQYIPRQDSNLFVPGSTIPDRQPVSNAFVAELSMPQSLLRTDFTTCRTANDENYMARSRRLFNNPTKQDRYGKDKFYALPDRDHEKGQPMPHGGVPLPRSNAVSQKGQMGQKEHTTLSKVAGLTTSGLAAPVW